MKNIRCPQHAASGLYLDDDGTWKCRAEIQVPEFTWNMDSAIRMFDDHKMSTSLPADEVISAVEELMVKAGYLKENLRFESYTDQIHGFVKYRDGKWRRLINIVYC